MSFLVWHLYSSFLEQIYPVEEKLCAAVGFCLLKLMTVPQEVMGLLFVMACQAQLFSLPIGSSAGCAKSVMLAPGGREYASKERSI